jgi:hypothetical protein
MHHLDDETEGGESDPRMRNAEATLDQVVTAYTQWVYSQQGSYTQAASTLQIDRRTVAKHIGDT